MTSGRGSSFDSILAVGRALVSDLDLESIFASVAAGIGEAMMVSAVDIQTLDAECDELVYVAYWAAAGVPDNYLEFLGHVVGLADWPTWRQVVDAPMMLERHIDDPDLPADEKAEMLRWRYEVTLDCPLVFAGTVVGVLGLRETRFPRRFTEVERDLLSQLCDLAAIAIMNARLYRRAQEEQGRLDALVEMGDALTSSLDLTGVCRAITRAAATALAAPRAVIYEVDHEADTITARAFFEADPFPGYDDTGTPEALDALPQERAILNERRAVFWQVSDPDLDEDVRAEMTRWQETTFLGLPLVFRDRALGILMITWTGQERELSEDELDFATGVAGHAAVALEQARLRRGIEEESGVSPKEASGESPEEEQSKAPGKASGAAPE